MFRAAILAAFAIAAALGPARAADPVKAAFVYVGPIGDHGWTYQHDRGRLALEEAFGDRVETLYVENVEEGPDAERAIERLARAGADIVFTTSFGFMNPTLKVAERFPDVKFEHATGYKRADNVATYSARFYEGRYVIGRIAARMSKSGVAGYVASFPIPEVVRGINAFLLGAQSVDPDFKVKIVWVSSWFDPGKEADAAKALIDQGADILAQHTDSPAPIQIAGERGVHGFGQASNMEAFAPAAHYTAIVNNWSAYYIARMQALLDGKWESGDVWGGFGADMVMMAPFTDMPPEVVAEAEELVERIRSGAFHPFTGPIYDQSGALRIAEGERADDGALLGMDWYVKGIDDRLPQ